MNWNWNHHSNCCGHGDHRNRRRHDRDDSRECRRRGSVIVECVNGKCIEVQRPRHHRDGGCGCNGHHWW